MFCLYTDRHFRQNGQAELNDGRLVPCFEMPERAEIVRRRLIEVGGHVVEGPDDAGEGPIRRVHDDAFVDFLKTVWDRWRVERGDYDALPLNWPGPRMRRLPSNILDGQLGYYSYDAGTPITAGTWDAAYAAAQLAITGADRLGQGNAGVFALCRPPGHHAGRDYYGGYCFLNNAAIAAQRLRDAGAARVAVLDVDYHHGNGTQDIFWERDDVFFASLHADPADEYPFFSGYADERGVGAGLGHTLNIPLPIGTGWDGYATALDHALGEIRIRGAEALVVSLGADTFEADPISRFKLGTQDFPRMGAAIAGLRLPTLFVLEGGYAVDALGRNVEAVLAGFESA